MSDWIVIGALVSVTVLALFAEPIFIWLDRVLMRVGLWMNGITGRQADDIIGHHERRMEWYERRHEQ